MLFELMLRDKQKEGYKKGLAEGRTEGLAQGRSEGLAESILTILATKGSISTELSQRIHQEAEISVLQSWLQLSTEISSVEEFQTKMNQSKK